MFTVLFFVSCETGTMTPTPRRQARDAFTRRLLEVAHRHLVEQGASGLGMRALARDLEAPPAPCTAT